MMNYTKKAVKGTGMVFIAMIGASFLAYFLRIILTRYLSIDEYGLFYAVMNFMMFLLIFRDMGLSSALNKFIPQYKVKKNYSKLKTIVVSALAFQIIFSLILVLFFTLSSSYLSEHYFKAKEAHLMLILFGIYVLSSVFTRTTRSILNGFQDAKWYSLMDPLRIGITFIMLFPLFNMGLGIFAPVISFIIGVTSTGLILLIGAKKYFFFLKYPIKNFVKTTKEMFRFSIPVVFTGFGNKVIAHLDTLLLTYFVPLAMVGVYNIVLPTALIFLSIGNNRVLFPMTSELWSKKDHKRLSEGLRMIYTYSFLVSVPVIFTVFVFSNFLIKLFFGIEYVSGVLAFRILLIGVLGYLIAMNNNAMISAIGKPLIVTKIIGTSAIINIGLNIILIPTFSITGAAIATSISYIFIMITSTLNIMKFIKVNPPWKIWLKIFFAGLVFLGLVRLVSDIIHINIWFEIAISFIVAGLAYSSLILLMKITTIKEIKTILIRLFNRPSS